MVQVLEKLLSFVAFLWFSTTCFISSFLSHYFALTQFIIKNLYYILIYVLLREMPEIAESKVNQKAITEILPSSLLRRLYNFWDKTRVKVKTYNTPCETENMLFSSSETARPNTALWWKSWKKNDLHNRQNKNFRSHNDEVLSTHSVTKG